MQLTTNFHLDEFACNDGTPVPEEFIENCQLLADNLQVLRDDLGIPVDVVSGFRTPAYNKKVGGRTKSFHLKAMAGDLQVIGMTPFQVHARIKKLIAEKKMKEGGLGLYPTFVHYDVRKTKARW